MTEFGITLGFKIVFKDGREEQHEEVSFERLEEKLFGERKKLRAEVDQIIWKEKSTLSIYDSKSDSVDRSIADGDVNPYGWRQKHR